jgi:ATP-dependent RNA helicase CshB
MSKTNFDRFGLKPFLLEAVNELKFYKPTDIQERLIPSILNGESAIGQSQTGTGKTHAYLLPIVNQIDPTKNEVQAVITAPTRELAQQIYHVLQQLTKFSSDEEEVTTKLFVGGTDKQRSIDKLKTQPHIVVGTPGRIRDLVKVQALFVHTSRVLVIDEADLMMDLGFIREVDEIAGKMPEELQILVFSATIPEKLKPFLKKYMENPKYTHVSPKQATAKKIEHVLVPVRHRDKLELVYEMATAYNPYLLLIFTNTRKSADEVANYLLSKGLEVGRIHGDLTPRERRKMMKQLKEGSFQFVVATDLAARGIDIEGVSHVLNVEFPQDLDFYIHRVGRTARAGYSGIATALYEQSDIDTIERLEKRGIHFKHQDLRNGQIVDLGEREKRKKRKPQSQDDEKRAVKMVKKPSKVKPGYKKKMAREVEKIKKRARRNKK